MFLDDSSSSNHYYDGISFYPYHAGPQLQGGLFDDLDDEFESSQAQEDWLDAILEDLMEEDGEEEDSATEYDSEDDDDN
ncbi:hypothetical protein BGZ65_011033, partial [Modicella reniformis]